MAIHLVIRGVVQGVGFRWFAVHEAQALGLSGWVKNRRDGSVEVAADGDSRALEAFQKRVTEGPPGATVDAIETLGDRPDAPLPKPFVVLR